MAFEEVYFDGRGYVSVERASILMGKTSSYVLGLCEKGELDAKRVGEEWFVSVDDINSRQNKNDNGEKVIGDIPVNLLPTRNTALLLAVLVGLFFYSNIYGGVTLSYFDKAFSFATSYSDGVRNLPQNLMANVSKASPSSVTQDFSRNTSILIRNTFNVPKNYTAWLTGSYLDLLSQSISIVKDSYVRAYYNGPEFSKNIILAPARLSLVWRDSYTSLNNEIVSYHVNGLTSASKSAKLSVSDSLADASWGLKTVFNSGSLALKEAETSNKDLRASVLGSVGETLDSLALRVQIAFKKTALFFSDLKNSTINNWSGFVKDKLKFKVREEVSTEVTNENIDLNEEFIRESIRKELAEILGDVSVTSVDKGTPFSVSNVNEGLAVFPSDNNDLTNQELINKIKASFSDNVSVQLDASGKSGVIRSNIPGDEKDYIFIIAPVNAN